MRRPLRLTLGAFLLAPGVVAASLSTTGSGSQGSNPCPAIQTSLHYPYVTFVPDCAPYPADVVGRAACALTTAC